MNPAGHPEGGFWSRRRVLVTGATGMIGSWLVRALIDAGADVVALIADPDPQSELYRSKTIEETTVALGRLEDLNAVERAVNEHDVDSIFHLGAQTIVGTATRSPVPTFEANIQGTWHIMEVCRRHSELVERIVVASSDKAYGEQSLPYREDMPLLGGHPYEASKACTDLITQSYHGTYGVPAAIARLGNVYGGGDLNWSRLVPGTIKSVLEGARPIIRSDGSYIRDFLYVKDAVGAYLTLGEAIGREDVDGEGFNFSTETKMTVMEMFNAVCNALGGDVDPEILDIAQGEIHDQYLAVGKARDVLGWKPSYSLEEGLSETIAWYRSFLG